MKKCGVNPETGRCVQGGTKTPSHCMKNPKTKRCRKKHTKHKKKRVTFSPKTTFKPCASGKIRNPQTNRCILKDSKIASKILITKETTTIGGPISIAYYEIEFDGETKHILLLGDMHTQYPYDNEPTVITVSTFLKKIIRNSPHCIDLFVERIVDQRQQLKAKGKRLLGYDSPLESVRTEFGSCPYHDTSVIKCKYDNLRYQNWDLRFSDNHHWKGRVNPYDEVCMSDSFDTAWQSFLRGQGGGKKSGILGVQKDVITYLLGLKTSPSSDHSMINDFFNDKIDIAMKNDKFKNMVATKDFQKYRTKVIAKQLKRVQTDKFPKDFVKTYLSIFHKNMHGIELTHVFTDFYLLCRMFQKFGKSSKKKTRTPKRCPLTKSKSSTKTSYDSSKYMIIYAGDDHNKYVQSFLQKMFNARPLY